MSICLLSSGNLFLDLPSPGSVTDTIGRQDLDGGLDLLGTRREGQLTESNARLDLRLFVSRESLCHCATLIEARCPMGRGIIIVLRKVQPGSLGNVLGNSLEFLTLLTSRRHDHS